MQRRSLLSGVGALFLASAFQAYAQVRRLRAAEIEGLLSGNTIVGQWSGTAYRQFFAADGQTIYDPAEGRREVGRWRVNPETDEFESWWRSTGWSPYAMVRREDESHAWVNGDRLEPFEVIEGRQIE